jgi:hypothetical protein
MIGSMHGRWLGLWIAALLVAGTVTAGARAGDDDGRERVTSEGLALDTSEPAALIEWPAWSPPSTTPLASSTTATSTRRTPRPTTPPTTAAPSLVGSTADVDQAGSYVIRRDGSGLRRVADGCTYEGYRRWLNSGELVVADTWDGPASRVSVGGGSAPFTLPAITDRFGRTVTLRGTGSPSPDGTRTVISFGGVTEFGVAIVDLQAQTSQILLWGDNPTPTWSPSGEILLVGPSSTKLLDGDGATIRDWAPSPMMMADPWISWSPDGSRVLAASASNINRWVVVDPRTNSSMDVPQIGTGRNQVAWAGPGKLVIGDAGTDHVVKPSLHLWDIASGQVTDIAEAAWMPTVPVDGQVVAFEDRSDHLRVGIAAVGGQQRADLVRVPAGVGIAPHSWSPDGTWLLFDVCNRTSSGGGLPTT